MWPPFSLTFSRSFEDALPWWFNHFPLPRPLPIYRTASQWNCQTQARLCNAGATLTLMPQYVCKRTDQFLYTGSNGFLLPANQIETVGRELWAATSVVGHKYSIHHRLMFYTIDWYTIEILYQIFPACQRSSPPQYGTWSSSCSGPCILSWTLKQRFCMTTQLTKVCFLSKEIVEKKLTKKIVQNQTILSKYW